MLELELKIDQMYKAKSKGDATLLRKLMHSLSDAIELFSLTDMVRC
jgi:hypothetical protein